MSNPSDDTKCTPMSVIKNNYMYSFRIKADFILLRKLVKWALPSCNHSLHQCWVEFSFLLIHVLYIVENGHTEDKLNYHTSVDYIEEKLYAVQENHMIEKNSTDDYI